jgi:ATP-binding cassette, subfamily B, putative efflux pump
MPDKPRKKQRSPLVVMGRIWRHMGRHRTMYVFGLSLGLIDAMCQAATPWILGTVLNQVQQDSAGFMAHRFWPWVIGGAALVVVFFPAAFYFHVLTTRAVARLTRDMRTSLYDHVQGLSADFFHRHKVGEITQRLNNDIDQVNMAAIVVMGLLWQVCMMLISISIMATINLLLTGLFVVLMAGVAVYSRKMLPKLRAMSRHVRDAVGEVSAALTEFIGLNELIKSYIGEPIIHARVRQRNNALRKQTEKMIWKQQIFGDTMQTMTRFFAPLTLLLIGAVLVARGRLLVGSLATFYGYWLISGNSVNFLVGGLTQIFTGLASADRVFDYFDQVPMIQNAPDAKPLVGVRGEIAFRDVVFHYPTEQGMCVLDHVSFTVPSGRRVAIVGPSGAGKSTVLQLIMRFYDPQEGAVTIDGRDIRQVTSATLRSHIGLVMQESVFFAGTIEDNLHLACPSATAEQMMYALESANATEFIHAMPQGLKTVLGERGVRLSGGQKQRLSIARVFLRNPPIVLLDEATSSLDSMAEQQVQAAMERLMQGRTVIIVAHRISTIQDADQILVLQEGHIVATGVHHDLLSAGGLYAQLCSHQQLDLE